MAYNLVSFNKIIFNAYNFNNQTKINSPEFTIDSNVWQISLNTKRDLIINGLHEDMCTISLKLISNNKQELIVSYKTFLIDFHLNKQFSEYYPKSIAKTNNEMHGHLITAIEFGAQKERFISNNCLIFGMYFWIEEQEMTKIQHLVNYRKTFNVKEVNDLKIICGHKEFFVSKAILSSYSEVLKKMFSNDMKEKITNELIIEDITEEVMKEFLKFIYFGISEIECFKQELLFVSDKYQVLELKTIVENLIFTEINAKNAIQMLLTFDKFNCNQMKDKTIQFMSRNLSLIREESLDEWKELIKNNFELSDKLIREMSKLIENPKNITINNDTLHVYTFNYIGYIE